MAAAFSLIVVLALSVKAFRKRAAVGRVELSIFLWAFCLLMCFQVATSTGVIPSSVQRTLLAVQIGLITCVFWLLIMNGLVGKNHGLFFFVFQHF